MGSKLALDLMVRAYWVGCIVTPKDAIAKSKDTGKPAKRTKQAQLFFFFQTFFIKKLRVGSFQIYLDFFLQIQISLCEQLLFKLLGPI